MDVSAQYGKRTALKETNLRVENGQFCVIVGPAGAGKTTLLNVIAGIKRPSAGHVYFDDQEVTEVPTWDRNVAMVFENYALYPDLTVFENLASPLRRLKYPRDRLEHIVRETAALLGIDRLLSQLPAHISNGQRQRVAIGRAIVRPSHILLMDEPLAHLDAKIAGTMRLELKKLQQRLRRTVVYVTHEYREALSLADWLVVLENGQILQSGTPREVFYGPVNLRVARIFGDPPRNLLMGRMTQESGRWRFQIAGEEARIEFGRCVGHEKLGDRDVALGVLPGDIDLEISTDTPGEVGSRPGTVLRVRIAAVEPQGLRNLIVAELGKQRLQFFTKAAIRPRSGEIVPIRLRLHRAMLFDQNTGGRIATGQEVMV